MQPVRKRKSSRILEPSPPIHFSHASVSVCLFTSVCVRFLFFQVMGDKQLEHKRSIKNNSMQNAISVKPVLVLTASNR